jgi:hypothetical protein
MLLQGVHTHPDVVINTYQPLLPRVPHQGRCTAVGASQIMDYADMSYNLTRLNQAVLHAGKQHM